MDIKKSRVNYIHRCWGLIEGEKTTTLDIDSNFSTKQCLKTTVYQRKPTQFTFQLPCFLTCTHISQSEVSINKKYSGNYLSAVMLIATTGIDNILQLMNKRELDFAGTPRINPLR
jgi:hypothetical protein